MAFDGVRVVEMGEGKTLAYAGKLLRDLGAEVVKVEPPGGDALRRYGPFPGDQPDPEASGMFAYLNGGKLGARLDVRTAAGRAALQALVEGADVVLHSFRPSEARALGLDYPTLAAGAPRRIVAAVTPFGSEGPYAEWRGYAIQAFAGGGVAWRTGAEDREPLTCPLDGAELHHGAVHAAIAVALAIVDRDRTGRGQFVDASTLDAVTIAVEGVWMPRVVYKGDRPLDRSGRRFSKTSASGMVRTKDGDFYIINLLDAHWQKLLQIFGSPEWGRDPRFIDGVALRWLDTHDRDELIGYIEQWTAQRTNDEIWALTRAEELPSQPVLTIPTLCESDHLRERGFFVAAPGVAPPLRVPGAPYHLSATPWRPPGPPPRLDRPSVTGWPAARDEPPAPGAAPPGGQPLSGLRVLDVTQVLAGPMLVRYLADYGADVILVETKARARHHATEADPSQPFTWEWFYRNRRSVTLDLRKPEAVALFKRLAAVSDLVIDNFTPRVMPKLGLGYEELRAVNPRLIVVSMSASGRSGPWADLSTYGPSLSALYGMKSLNGYPDTREVMDDNAELDAIASGYAMLAILAALHHRNRTGEGQFIELAQGEAGLAGMAEAVIEHFWNRRAMGPQGNRHRELTPHGIYPCAGDDRWIAIACGSQAEWEALARAAGHEEWLRDPRFASAETRRASAAPLDAAISAWTRGCERGELAARLQAAGVAAFPVMDTLDIVGDPHHAFRRRHFELHEGFPAGELLDGNPWRLSAARPRLRRPAPNPGDQNYEVFGGLLGLSADAVEQLIAAGVIA